MNSYKYDFSVVGNPDVEFVFPAIYTISLWSIAIEIPSSLPFPPKYAQYIKDACPLFLVSIFIKYAL